MLQVMRAAQIQNYGGPESITITDTVEKPSLKPGQILVEVHASALNPFDSKLRSGVYKEMIPLQFPFILGGDFSGVINEIGEGVTEYALGDEVFGTALGLTGGSGAFAEFATANTKNISKKPTNVSHVEAAALVLVGVSAIQAIEQHINLQPKQRILLHGGAGGIGSVAIQLAKSKGAYVATTVSLDSKSFVQQLGADEVIDYKNQKFEELLHDYDAVYDTVGGDTTDRSFAVLKRGGVIVSMLGKPNQERAKELGITAIGQMTNTNAEHLSRLKTLIETNVIKPQIDKTFPFFQVRESFTYLETGHPRGKVVLTVR